MTDEDRQRIAELARHGIEQGVVEACRQAVQQLDDPESLVRPVMQRAARELDQVRRFERERAG